MTNVDKKELFDEACKMISESITILRKADNILTSLGIEICNYVNFYTHEYDFNTNIQILKGINNVEKLTGLKSYYKQNAENNGVDKSQKFFDYKEIHFIQLGDKIENKQENFRFR